MLLLNTEILFLSHPGVFLDLSCPRRTILLPICGYHTISEELNILYITVIVVYNTFSS